MEAPPQRSRRDLLIEIAIVLLAFAGPFVYTSTKALIFPGSIPKQSYLERGMTSLMYYFTILPIILYVVWRSNEGFRRFGLTTWKTLMDIPLAIFVFFVDYFFLRFPERLLAYLAPTFAAESYRIIQLNRAPHPHGIWELALAVVLQILNGFREEFVMRGYLITRLEDLNMKPWLTLALPALLFASYHLYEGPLAALTIFFVGLTFGAVFKVRRSIWPIVLAHAAWNLHLYFK